MRPNDAKPSPRVVWVFCIGRQNKMPYMIQMDGDRHCIHKKQDDGSAGKKIACHDTKDKAATKENKNKFYPACDGLTKHIASKIGVNDLLIFNKSTVQINPKYI